LNASLRCRGFLDHPAHQPADKAIAAAFAANPQAAIIRSCPGMRPLVVAEFVIAVGDLSTVASPYQLACGARKVDSATLPASIR
jgi:hypothetical protein